MSDTPSPVTHGVTLLVLLLCTALSWFLSRSLPDGWDLTAALVIAAIKASLVALVFMDLRHRLLRAALALIVAAVLGLLLIALVIGDVALRDRVGDVHTKGPL